jgi:uncharacterized membrane protein (DUF373 family)
MKIVERIERIIIIVLMVLMLAALVLSTVALGVTLFQEIITPPVYILNLQKMMDIFGYILMVLIGLELLETIKAYFIENRFHLEIVLIVAMIAVSRKVIILDYRNLSPILMLGIASIIFALSVGYYLVMKTRKNLSASESEKF